MLKCACGDVLGKKRSAEEKFGAGTLRFSKWSIALLRGEDDSDSVEYGYILAGREIAYAQTGPVSSVSVHHVRPTRARTGTCDISFRHLRRRCLRCAFAHLGIQPQRENLVSQSGRTRRVVPPSDANIAGETRIDPEQAVVFCFSDRQRAREDFASGQDSVQGAGQWSAEVSRCLRDTPQLTGSTIVPGFGTTSGGQVENLSYPTEVCEGLVAALRESNSVYPPGARRMIGLEVGFLERL